MDRLPSHIWVDALIRRVQFGGASAFILKKGDNERGDVLIKIALMNGQAAYLVKSPLSFENVSYDWLPEAEKWSEESLVDEQIRKRMSYDPDLWVVEIEDTQGRHFLTEYVNGECNPRD